MNVTSSNSLSGMQAAQTRLQASAHNIANMNTPNFNRQGVTLSTQSGGGTNAMVSNQASGVGIEADMVQQLQAKNAFLANLSVFKTSDAVLGTLINIAA